MEFKSIDEAVNYIKSICSLGMNPMAEEIKEIMKDEILLSIYEKYDPKVYDRTGDLENSPQITGIDSNTAEVEYEDNGDWRSQGGRGEHFFPLEGFKVGAVWGREGEEIDVVEDSKAKCEIAIPPKFKEYLINKGLNVI